MNLEETRIQSKRIFEGRVINVRVDEVRLQNGETSTREIVEHKGAVCVVPLTEDNCVYMVKQFRYAFNEAMLEIPAGKLDSVEEKRDEAVRRELEEEVGLKAGELIYLGEFRPSVAIFTEVIHMYLAKGLYKGAQHLDEDEFLEVYKYPLDEVVQMILKGEIKDGKTIAAVLKVKILNG